MADTVVYLYAVTDAGAAPADPAVGGVDASTPRRIVVGALAAVVSSVDASRFSEEALRRSLEDLPWLEDVARAHHTVVASLARTGPVAPVRLATVYLDDDNVRALLDARADELAAVLDRVRGRTEWGVKGYAARTTDGPPPSTGPGDDDRPGTSYLMRRRAERDRSARGHQQAAEAAEAAHREIATVSVASRRYPAQDPRLTGHREEMLLNAAYLVDDSGADAVARVVEGWDGQEVRLELTGPWAPYSFATLEES